MISIITCSVNPGQFQNFQQNIAETIGVAYELIRVDNTGNRYGICEAYNLGGHRASYPVLCFIHEDTAFETMDWGLRVERHLRDKTVGLLGIAGGDAKSLVPSSWSSPIRSNEINLVQSYKSDPGRTEWINVTGAVSEEQLREVATLDGVCLIMRRELFKEFAFDEVNFPGFHGYDIDYSLQVGRKYRLYVMPDILVRHFSEGTPDRKWMKSAMQVSNKWKTTLPVSIYQDNPEFELHHWRTMQMFIQKLIRLNYPAYQVIWYLNKYSVNRFFNLRRYASMWKYSLLSILRRFRNPDASQ